MDNPSDPAKAPTDNPPKVLSAVFPDIFERWSEYFVFAHEFDGYATYPDNLRELANQAINDWNEHQVLSDHLNLLRSFLFYEARRSRFIEGYPTEADMDYIDALVAKINASLKNT